MRKAGNFCTLMGVVLLALGLMLVLWNQSEDDAAGLAADRTMVQLYDRIADNRKPETMQNISVPDPYDTEMTEVEIDGIKYVGYLSIPTLGLDLPIISEWSYPYLKKSPCRYYGSSKTDDLILMAHNYKRHFGTIRTLKAGDDVFLTDMDGVVNHYQVAAVEVLTPTAVEDMTSGAYDLTLFTCTFGGKSRVTVRCDRVTDGNTERS